MIPLLPDPLDDLGDGEEVRGQAELGDHGELAVQQLDVLGRPSPAG
jgi:hypothetical protein